MSNNRTEFRAFIVLVTVGLVAAVTAYALKTNETQVEKQHPPLKSTAKTVSSKTTGWPLLWGPPNPDCSQKKSQFSFSPIKVKDITLIQPMGELAEGHVVPGEHIGINYAPNPKTNGVTVVAPADGYIATIERHQYIPEGGFSTKLRNYHVYLVHDCNLFTGFVHVTNLSKELLAANPELQALDSGTVDSRGKNIWPQIPVKAGQTIGTANGFGLLGMVTVDLTKTINGYANPANYEAESWRMHAVSPLAYFPSSIKNQLLAKNTRRAEPVGGKFDFDIEGKLIGSWFEPGSGGVSGNGAGLKRCGNFPCPAQDGQIAFVYDYIDPAQLRISIGHNWGLSGRTPYGVSGNAPDFKDIGKNNGLLRYELAPLRNENKSHGVLGEHAVFTETDDQTVFGTLLVQVMSERQIKAEVFPNQRAYQVRGFTANARPYER